MFNIRVYLAKNLFGYTKINKDEVGLTTIMFVLPIFSAETTFMPCTYLHRLYILMCAFSCVLADTEGMWQNYHNDRLGNVSPLFCLGDKKTNCVHCFATTPSDHDLGYGAERSRDNLGFNILNSWPCQDKRGTALYSEWRQSGHPCP